MNNKRLFLSITLLLITLMLTACGGDSGTEQAAVSSGDVAKGEELYNSVCIACHGPDGAGIEGLGKPFAGSEFIAGNDDEALLAFVKVGRPASDPANTTGVDMLPKGGNPALTDANIIDIIAYLAHPAVGFRPLRVSRAAGPRRPRVGAQLQRPVASRGGRPQV